MVDVELVRHPSDLVAGAMPVDRAIDRLRRILDERGVHVGESRVPSDPSAASTSVRLAGGAKPRLTDVSFPEGDGHSPVPESFAIIAGDRVVEVQGADVRGLTYATLELADRIAHADDPIAALRLDRPIVEAPANAVRSVMRLFCSRVEDLGWFRDESWWRDYLAMLIARRFNRVNLALGLGYNYHRGITDAYLYFAYPFLLDVAGYRARVPQLPDEERERNLSALRFASDEAAAVGLEFQLGLWTHAYEWIDSPHADQTIEGLAAEEHAPYCRDGLTELLDRCPSISGLTFRIHGESGVPERSWDFWRTVFEAVRDAGRDVRLDLHAKGLDRPTLEAALETGRKVTVSPKFWAEHMGLPYHQAAIRELERPAREDPSGRSEWHRFMAVSEGSRPFTRYGYGDFLREDREYDVVFRLWAGTQRLLLWGDPAFASAYGRASSLVGARGLEWCEPLTFKGREGSGLAESRTGYADERLDPRRDWEKYAYAYRLFGRLTYDPDADPVAWRRWLGATFGDVADAAEDALASASRILPLVTTAHHPSASNNYFWPELYTDMPIVWSDDGTRPHPYLDTPEPRRFGTVSPLDPEVFASVVECVEDFLAGRGSGRITPTEVAGHLEALSDRTEGSLASIRSRVREPSPELRRWTIDAAIQAGLGRFFAGKLRAAVRYELAEATGRRHELAMAVDAYRGAVRAWHQVVAAAGDAYVGDLTFGREPRLRGHWRDRSDAIEADLEDMVGRLQAIDPSPDEHEGLLEHDRSTTPLDVDVLHSPPEGYQPDADLDLSVRLRGPDAGRIDRVTLRHRPMNQALPYGSVTMTRFEDGFRGRISRTATDGVFPLAYAFIVVAADGRAHRHPGLGDDLAAQPYFVIRPRG